MTSIVGPRDVAAALVELVPALVLAVGAHASSRYFQGRARRWLPHPAWLLVLHYVLCATFRLVPLEVFQAPPPLLRALQDASIVAVVLALPGYRHLQEAERGARVGRRWLAWTWGSAAAVSAFAVLFPRLAPLPGEARATPTKVVAYGYCLVMAVLILAAIRRHAQPGRWRPGNVGGPSRWDVAFFVAGAALLGAAVLPVMAGRDLPSPVLHAAIGLAFTLPTLVPVLGQALRELAIVVGTTAMGAAVAGAYVLFAPAAGPARPAVRLAAALAFVAAVVPGQTWLRGVVDRRMFARGIRRRAALQEFVQTLSPEDGAPACAGRALERLVSSMQLRGAGLVLRDGVRVSAGALALGAVADAWPAVGALDLPPTLTPGDYRRLPDPARRALEEAGVLGVIAVASPRGRRGHLFIATTLLGNVFSEEDEHALFAFADQLALVLDAAELLARTVAAERALAHAEKLAAIGETAARIAHEIRNPITAARSLAQQLAREPGAGHAAEHALILEELERVERQVRALLRFARREDVARQPCDLSELVQGVLAAFRPRLDAASIVVALDTPPGVVAPIDREKMRQALVNLIENALDALGEVAGPRRLRVATAASNGVVTVALADNGPGVPADALPRLFEPFFSLKPTGTGLGLAIVRRTVEAHGGRVRAAPAPGGGAAFSIELPAGEGAA